MKRLLLILILTFSFQTLAKADDIRDFEIEGVSVEASLLDYFNEDEIIDKINSYKNKGFIYGNDKKAFYALTFKRPERYEKYDGLQIILKSNDKKYIIYALVGEIYHKDINNCYNIFDEIEDTFDFLFKDSNKEEKLKRPHSFDKTGDSTTTDVYYNMDNGDVVALVCTDWSIEMNISDSFRVELLTDEFADWLNNVVYK